MLCNVNPVDRAVRVLFAIVLIGAAVYFIPTPVPKTIALAAALGLIISAWTGVCYLYKILGISSARSNIT